MKTILKLGLNSGLTIFTASYISLMILMLLNNETSSWFYNKEALAISIFGGGAVFVAAVLASLIASRSKPSSSQRCPACGQEMPSVAPQMRSSKPLEKKRKAGEACKDGSNND